jgi:hypothetical protein
MTAQATKPLTSFQVLDATGLKLLAAGLMLLDHIHQMFADAGAPVWLSMLGRLVFPIFLFAASESFHYTHSRKNYLLRLLLADCGMVLFTTVLQTVLPNEHVVLLNNAFSTFVVAGIWMLAWDELTAGVQAGKVRQILKAVLWGLLPILGALPVLAAAYWAGQGVLSGSLLQILVTIGLMIPNVLTCEGGAAMAALGVGFYILRRSRLWQMVLLVLLSAAVWRLGSGYQWMMGFAVLPLALYNGKPGRGYKSFFYLFYPLHIGILYVLSALYFAG